jgi:HlyD family secretion protein
MQLPLIGKVSRGAIPWLVGLSAAGLVGVTLVGSQVLRARPGRDNLEALTVAAEQKDLTVRIGATGSIVPVRTVNLSPKTSGRLLELLVEQGDRVQQGQVIARMENQDLQAERNRVLAEIAQATANLSLVEAGSRPEAIAQAEQSVQQARAEVQAAQERLNLASTRVQRNRTLYSDGAISRDRLDEVLNEERSARASLAQAEARLRNTQAQLEQLRNGSRVQEIDQAAAQVAAAQARLQSVETQLSDTVIRAPFAGIITQKYATEGAFVTPTTSASSTTSATSTSIVALASDLEVLAKVPEVDIGQIRLNQAVEIRADAYPDRIFKGTVRLIAPEAVVEQNVTFFQVRVKITTGLDQLRSGMNADLTFLGRKLDNALIVPTVAIVTNRGQTGVLVVGANRSPRFQAVTIGPSIGNQTQILEGLRAGDRVYVELPSGVKLDDIVRGLERR